MPSLERFALKPHGTRIRYVAGCRCVPCRAANSRYESERLRARREGDWNGLVSAARARAHLRKLSAIGVGRRSVCAATDVGQTTIQDVKSGRKRFIRARTERKLLAVTVEAASDHAVIPAAATWKKIRVLLAEGFTRTELARRLGSKAKVPALQLREDMILARSAGRVDRIYRTVMAGA